MIPKKIHYCWFGGRPLPDDVKLNIETWRRYLPDFKIKQWDEANFDINRNRFSQQAYFAKKYAYVSDVARIYALVTEGGLYFDTDIILKRSFPSEWFENFEAFFGFEHDHYITTGVIAAKAHHPYLEEFLSIYNKLSFFKGLSYDFTTNVHRLTPFIKNKGFVMNNKFQIRDGIAVFPQIYLCGKDWQTGRYDNEETYALHDFQGGWGKDILRNPFSNYWRMGKVILKWRISKK